MIPLRKLDELPRSQKFRKAAKLARNAELRLVASGLMSAEEAAYFVGLTELLVKELRKNELCKTEETSHQAALDELKEAQKIFSFASSVSSSSSLESEAENMRRALNSVYHLLLSETGHNEADWDFIEASGALDQSRRRPFPGMQIYLEDVRSPFNVGSMFRTAESFGAEKIWLSPLCADPRHKRAARSSMGCVDVLPWERLTRDPFAEGACQVPAPPDFTSGPFFALETGGVTLEDFAFPARGVLIAGSEELGVSPRSLAASDASLGRVTIPTRGAKGSLNVSVAFGIVMQAWAERINKFLAEF